MAMCGTDGVGIVEISSRHKHILAVLTRTKDKHIRDDISMHAKTVIDHGQIADPPIHLRVELRRLQPALGINNFQTMCRHTA